MGTIDKLVKSVEGKSYGEYVIKSSDIPSPSQIIAKANEDISIGSKYSFTNGRTDVTTWEGGVNPENIPITQSREFYAVVKVNKYNVTFEWNKFDRPDEPTQEIEYGNSPNVPDSSWIGPNTGFTFVGWTVNGVDVVDFPYPIYEDTDFTAKWQSANMQTIYYKVIEDDGLNLKWAIKDVAYEIGYVITENDVPTLAEMKSAVNAKKPALGYGAEAFSFPAEGSEYSTPNKLWPYVIGLTVEQMTDSAATKYYHVERKTVRLVFDHNNGTGSKSYVYCYYALSDIVPNAPQYSHHTFNGWMQDSNHSIIYWPGDIYYDEYVEPDASGNRPDITFTAKWDTDKVTVKFYVNGELKKTQNIDYGGYATPPNVTVGEGESFDGIWRRRNCSSNCEWDSNRFSNEAMTDSLTEFDAVISNEITVTWVGVDEYGTEDGQVDMNAIMDDCKIELSFYEPRPLQQEDIPTLSEMLSTLSESDRAAFSEMNDIDWAIKPNGYNRYQVINPLEQGIITEDTTFYGLFKRNIYAIDWMRCNGQTVNHSLTVPHGCIPSRMLYNTFGDDVGCGAIDWVPSIDNPVTEETMYYPMCNCLIKIKVVSNVGGDYALETGSVTKISAVLRNEDGTTSGLNIDVNIGLGNNITGTHYVDYRVNNFNLPHNWISFSLLEAHAYFSIYGDANVTQGNSYQRSNILDDGYCWVINLG